MKQWEPPKPQQSTASVNVDLTDEESKQNLSEKLQQIGNLDNDMLILNTECGNINQDLDDDDIQILDTTADDTFNSLNGTPTKDSAGKEYILQDPNFGKLPNFSPQQFNINQNANLTIEQQQRLLQKQNLIMNLNQQFTQQQIQMTQNQYVQALSLSQQQQLVAQVGSSSQQCLQQQQCSSAAGAAIDEYYYIIKQQARQSYDYSTGIRFAGRTVQEFKQEIFQIDPQLQNNQNICYKDLEVIYNKKLLTDEDEMEYCLSTPENPLIIFLPTELSMQEYKNYMTVALSAIDNYKRQAIEFSADALRLQQTLERIIFNFALPHMEDADLQAAIPDCKKQMVAINLNNIKFHKKTEKQEQINLDDDEEEDDDDISILESKSTQAESTLNFTQTGANLSAAKSDSLIGEDIQEITNWNSQSGFSNAKQESKQLQEDLNA